MANYTPVPVNGYNPNHATNTMPLRTPNLDPTSPMTPYNNNPFDSMASNNLNGDSRANLDGTVELAIRKLPKHTTRENLRAMLLFAKEQPLTCGIMMDGRAFAKFRSASAAEEVMAHLHGKQNGPNESPIEVEILRTSPGYFPNMTRNNEPSSNRANSSSSTGSSTAPMRRTPRFNGTFQTMDRIQTPNGMPVYANDGSCSTATDRNDLISPYSGVFSPQSPIGRASGDRQRASGKAVIGEDGIDDEPGDLLKDPVAFAAMNDNSGQLSRHTTSPQIPLSSFSNLSLNTSAAPSFGLGELRTSGFNLQSPTYTTNAARSNALHQSVNQHPEKELPPCNPADKYPPCNTLYVGNLPHETSEEELKALFSKERGYKRLCFRVKPNGPMCFVEFEDVTAATKTLDNLYGRLLPHSVKGGIRLSYSKNPLGVRSGQPGGMNQPPLSPGGPPPGMNGFGMTPFSTANGPPPGLAAPPGLNHMVGMNGLAGPGFGMGMGNFRGPQLNGVNGYQMNGMTSPQGNGMNGYQVNGMTSPQGNGINGYQANGMLNSQGNGMNGYQANGVTTPPGSGTTGPQMTGGSQTNGGSQNNGMNGAWNGPNDQFPDYMLGR